MLNNVEFCRMIRKSMTSKTMVLLLDTIMANDEEFLYDDHKLEFFMMDHKLEFFI